MEPAWLEAHIAMMPHLRSVESIQAGMVALFGQGGEAAKAILRGWQRGLWADPRPVVTERDAMAFFAAAGAPVIVER